MPHTCHTHSTARSWRPRTRVLALLVMVVSLLIAAAPLRAEGERYAAIVVDAASGQVLLEERADIRHYPASLTKMMTLYLLFDALERGRLSMSSRLPVSAKAAAQEPSKVGVTAGSSISVEQAINALAIKSANDVAVVVAESLGGSETAFGQQMTAMARRLGMWRTNFVNASGLPDERQLSTPRDMAKLSRALLYDFPQYYHFFSQPGFSFGSQRYNSHNRLLYSYGGADGIKTGYTRAAGYNISVSAVRNGRRLIAVVFGADSSRWRNSQAASLLDRSFPSVAGGHPRTLFAEVRAGRRLPALKPNLSAGAGSQLTHVVPPPPAAAPVPAAVPSPAPTAAPAATVPSVQVAAAKASATPTKAAPSTRAAAQPAQQTQTISYAAVAAPLSGQQATLRRWAIQVGAFSVSEAAHAAADEARRATQGLAGGRVQVVEVVSGDGRLYRGRIAGLAENDARAACDFRILHGAPCMVIAPGT